MDCSTLHTPIKSSCLAHWKFSSSCTLFNLSVINSIKKVKFLRSDFEDNLVWSWLVSSQGQLPMGFIFRVCAAAILWKHTLMMRSPKRSINKWIAAMLTSSFATCSLGKVKKKDFVRWFALRNIRRPKFELAIIFHGLIILSRLEMFTFVMNYS